MGTTLTNLSLAQMEATVTSKGRVTLPKALRDSLGIQSGSRIRFSRASHGGFQGVPIRFDLDDLWEKADAGPREEGVMSYEDMDAAKARGCGTVG